MAQPERPRLTIRRMRSALWVTKATGTHSKYVMRTVFQSQHWLRERASTFRLYFTSSIVFVATPAL